MENQKTISSDSLESQGIKIIHQLSGKVLTRLPENEMSDAKVRGGGVRKGG